MFTRKTKALYLRVEYIRTQTCRETSEPLPLYRNEEKCSKMRINSSHFNRKYNTIYSYDIILFFQEIWNNRPLFLHAGVFIRNVNKVCDQNTKHIAQLHRELRPSLLLPSGI